MEFNYVSPENVHYHDFSSYLFTEHLRGCGCGNSDEIAEDVLKIFILFAEKTDDRYRTIYKDKYNELIAHMIDGAELIEHGSSIGGSWLNEKGEALYKEYLKTIH